MKSMRRILIAAAMLLAVLGLSVPAAAETGGPVTRGANDPEFTGYSLTLNDTLDLKYYIQTPEGFNALDTSMTFSLGGRTVTQSRYHSEGNNVISFTCPVYAYEMGETIMATLAYDEGETLTNIYSVETYLKKIAANENGAYSEPDISMAAATLTYGKYMLIYLDDYHHWNGKYTPVTWNGTVDVAAARAGVSGYGAIMVETYDRTQIDSVQYYLNPNESTKMNFVIKLKPEVTGPVTSEENQALQAESGNTYRVSKASIGASNLDTRYRFRLQVSGSLVFDVRASVMSYVKTVLNASAYPEELDAMAALVQYYVQALRYQ